eukprot:gnl/Trimastix_PCT/4093.p1 GENE.gnl/Trimastix_PCT/4093~~gnl/Trimastix_PCT/4093.p1  ORF type:complete len:1496 (-),score=347.32 gnl/Trimastix_PCT/4093:114-4601(-)
MLKAEKTLDEHLDSFANVVGYEFSRLKLALFIFVSSITLGISLLFCHWFPAFYLNLRYRRCPLERATKVLVKDQYERQHVCTVVSLNAATDPIGASPCPAEASATPSVSGSPLDGISAGHDKMLVYKHQRFLLDAHARDFTPVRFNWQRTYAEIREHMSGGLDSAEHARRQSLFGLNSVEVPVKPAWRILLEEAIHPFFVFQILSTLFWMLDNYYIYASSIFFISVISVVTSFFETRRNLVNIHKMSVFKCTLGVFRDHAATPTPVDSTDLLPGDRVELTGGLTLPCDVLLLSGQTVVNEAMLTGESVPVLKSPLPYSDAATDVFNPEQDKKHVLYGGTRIIQVRNTGHSPVLGIVLRTGFSTAKGQLIRSMLFPKPSKFRFYQDSFRFIAVLACVAFLGWIASVIQFIRFHVPVKEIILRACDLITIVVPPALPAAMTIGTAFALRRLKRGDIFCISPPRVNVCGKLRVMCFDKTGTLTEDGLDVRGVHACLALGGPCGCEGTETVDREMIDGDRRVSDPSRPLCVAMAPRLAKTPEGLPPALTAALASCHSLTRVDGELIGDPLELRMFEYADWCLEENNDPDAPFSAVVHPRGEPPIAPGIEAMHAAHQPLHIGLLRRFDFSSRLQRMSVIVKNLQKPHMELMTKGAPERVASLCLPETIPPGFESVLHAYTQRGFRVIALASRSLRHLAWHRMERVARQDVEKDLHFLGLLVMENRLRPQSRPSIRELQQAGIRNVMVTGDNALTAIHVARNCALLPQEAPVYLGDISNDEIVWTDINDPASRLDPHTLLPVPRSPDADSGRSLDSSVVVTEATPQGERDMEGQSPRDEGCMSVSVCVSEDPSVVIESSEASDSPPMTPSLASPLLIPTTQLPSPTPSELSFHCNRTAKEAMLASLCPAPPPTPAPSPFPSPFASPCPSPRVGGESHSSGAPSSSTTPLAMSDPPHLAMDPQPTPQRPPAAPPPHDNNNNSNTDANHGLPSFFAPHPGSHMCVATSPSEGGDVLCGSGRGRGLGSVHVDDDVGVRGDVHEGREEDKGKVKEQRGEDDRLPLLQRKGERAATDKRAKQDPYYLAVTGALFQRLLNTDDGSPACLLNQMLLRTPVFARMGPDHKTHLVERLGELGFCVGMCGDGANDCGALRAAQVGISLSEVEASIAAPFTSRQANISCVIRLIREGRCALVTSFQCFKYMALYSMIQFFSVILLYTINSNLSDSQYLWIDLFTILPLAITMGYTDPYDQLVKQRPSGSLISFSVLSSLFGQMAVILLGQLGAYTLLSFQSWFVPLHPDPDKNNIICYENTTLFLFTSLQYIWIVYVLSISKPFRKPFYTNYLFLLSLVALSAAALWLFLYPFSWMRHLFNTRWLPLSFRLTLFAICMGSLLVSWAYERFFVVWNVRKRFRAWRRQRRLAQRAAVGTHEAVLLGEWSASLESSAACVEVKRKAKRRPKFRKRYHEVLYELRRRARRMGTQAPAPVDECASDSLLDGAAHSLA